ncbi:MAG: hypothetical protein EOM50_19910, partial [Erysipelotrichia bacterium]|nr:hypothetical protein [Erysipelotrichia bacterium]
MQNTQQQVTPQPTPQPEPQVCTGVTYDLSRGNSGLLFKTRAEFDAWVEKYDAYWVNGYEKFENEYGHVGWEQVRVIAYDSCGNELD